MRAVVITEAGGPEVLSVVDVDDPVPGPEELLVRVVSSALNRADLLQRRGLYPGPPAEHDVPGLEFAGVVEAVGERVTCRRVGDAVMGIVAGAAHAELLTVHERQSVPVPAELPLADAGAVPEAFLTAFDALVLQGGLRAGGTALVHAGASGVGTAAIQMCRRLRARVIVTASAGKLDACTDLGATAAVDYAGDWPAAVAEAAGPGGIDTVLDVVGGEYLAHNLRLLRVGGTIVQVGVMAGGSATLPLGLLLPKRASIVGTVLRGRPLEEKIAVSQRFGSEVVPGFADATLHPVVHARFALDDVADAHRLMESNANVGKIVLDVAHS